MAAGQTSLDSNYDNIREAVPKTQVSHRRQGSIDSVEFGQGAQSLPKEDDGALHSNHEQQFKGDPSPVNSSTETVVATTESVLKHNMPGTQSRENSASERSGGDTAARNLGMGPSPLHSQAYPGRLGNKLQPHPRSERKNTESGTALLPGKTQSDKGAKLPKFGEWDYDPASAEGYTAIFKKITDEKKKRGAGQFPSKQADSLLPNKSAEVGSQKEQESSCSSWLCGCFHSSGTK